MCLKLNEVFSTFFIFRTAAHEILITLNSWNFLPKLVKALSYICDRWRGLSCTWWRKNWRTHARRSRARPASMWTARRCWTHWAVSFDVTISSRVRPGNILYLPPHCSSQFKHNVCVVHTITDNVVDNVLGCVTT